MLKQVLLLFFLVGTVLAETAYFAFKSSFRDKEFIVKINRDEDIWHARDLLHKVTNNRPHIRGKIAKYRVLYNKEYSYHIIPNTVQFFNRAPRTCNATFSYTEKSLDITCGEILPQCEICPLFSEIIREVDEGEALGVEEIFTNGGYSSNVQNCS